MNTLKIRLISIAILMVIFLSASHVRSENNSYDLKSIMDNETLLINNDKEKELEKSTGDYIDLSDKLAKLIVAEFDIEGQWDSQYWHDGVHLFIQKKENDSFAVYYHARGDLMSWSIKRTATFQNGLLEFNKPISEYIPFGTYKHFYLLNTPYGIRFVSQPIVRHYFKEGDWFINDNLLIKTK